MSNQQRMVDNMTIMVALQEVSKEKAIESISHPDLDPKELSELIECSLLGKIKMKDGSVLKLDNDVLIAGVRNRFNQIADKKIFD